MSDLSPFWPYVSRAIGVESGPSVLYRASRPAKRRTVAKRAGEEMSSTQQGPDWWLASDGRWYPPPGPGGAANSEPSTPLRTPRQTRAHERLFEETRRWLEPDEQLVGAFVGQTGPPGIGTWGPGALLQRYWIVGCTDRSVVIGPLGVKGTPERLSWEAFEMPHERPGGSSFEITIGTRKVRVSADQFDEVASLAAVCRDRAGVRPSAAESTTSAEPQPQPGPEWHPDPTGRHQLRYWDGSQWTSYVADSGVQGEDPVVPAATPRAG